MAIDEGQLQASLAQHTRVLLEDNWAVAAATAAGSTAFPVRLQTAAAVVPYVGPSRIGVFLGASLTFTSGANVGFQTTVVGLSSAVSGGTVTTTLSVADPLPQSLSAGDTFAIYALPPEGPRGAVASSVIAPGALGFVASGDEVAYDTLTIGGIYRVDGGLYVQSLVVDSGGLLLQGPGSTVEIGAFQSA